MHTPIVTVLAAIALTGLGTSSADAEDTSVTVSYADLNLASREGVDALYARIGKALDRVCGKPDMRDLKATYASQRCHADGRQAAMERLSLATRHTTLASAD